MEKWNTEDIEGFTIESSQQAQLREALVIKQSEAFDSKALNADAGMRAVWILVARRNESALYELGVDLSALLPRLNTLKIHYGESISDRQVWRLQRLFPELNRASERLRELYVLKFYLRER